MGFESTEDGVEDDVVDERDLGVTKATSGSCCLGEICTISIDSPLGFISGSFSAGFDDVMFMFVSSRKSIFGFLFLFLFFLFFVFSLSVLTVKPFDLIGASFVASLSYAGFTSVIPGFFFDSSRLK